MNIDIKIFNKGTNDIVGCISDIPVRDDWALQPVDHIVLQKKIEKTLNFWIQNRINGVSASMCDDAEFIYEPFLKCFDAVRDSVNGQMVELTDWTEALMPEYVEEGIQDEDVHKD